MATYRQPGHIKKPTFDGDGDIRGGVKLEWDKRGGKGTQFRFFKHKINSPLADKMM